MHLNHRDSRSSETLKLFTKLLGALCRDLAFAYLPMTGLYLAGSVARGLWESGMADVLVAEIGQKGKFGEMLSRIPVTLVCEDSAALIGCV